MIARTVPIRVLVVLIALTLCLFPPAAGQVTAQQGPPNLLVNGDFSMGPQLLLAFPEWHPRSTRSALDGVRTMWTTCRITFPRPSSGSGPSSAM